jgi:hypothetical protein
LFIFSFFKCDERVDERDAAVATYQALPLGGAEVRRRRRHQGQRQRITAVMWRTGDYGKIHFNIEGANNGPYVDYGVAKKYDEREEVIARLESAIRRSERLSLLKEAGASETSKASFGRKSFGTW